MSAVVHDFDASSWDCFATVITCADLPKPTNSRNCSYALQLVRLCDVAFYGRFFELPNISAAKQICEPLQSSILLRSRENPQGWTKSAFCRRLHHFDRLRCILLLLSASHFVLQTGCYSGVPSDGSREHTVLTTVPVFVFEYMTLWGHTKVLCGIKYLTSVLSNWGWISPLLAVLRGLFDRP